jgi:hypothetical protein
VGMRYEMGFWDEDINRDVGMPEVFFFVAVLYRIVSRTQGPTGMTEPLRFW